MGNAATKITCENNEELSENAVPSAPILTPQVRRLDLDPRSPSTEISRTPIEVLKTPAVSADNSLNLTEDLSNCIEDDNNVTSEDHYTKLTLLDPRSPTAELHRTPIIIEDIPKDLPLRNKNLERVLMPPVAITPIKPKKISERVIRKIYEPVKSDGPKLLESNPIVINVTENKRNSVVGLLETNIDFVETDLDVVIQKKLSDSKHEASVDDENISSSSSEESLKSSVDSLEDGDNVVNVIKTDNSNTESAEDDNKENIEINIEVKTELLNTESDIKTAICVDELNKKLTSLIYEDKQYESSPKSNKTVTAGNRTPLGDRSNAANAQQQRKSIPVLRVSDKPKRTSASKIPVYKEKKGGRNKMINVQCENTPPRMQPKRSQWGAEDSIII